MKVVALGVWLAFALLAQDTIGSVSSSEPFQMRGAMMPAAGVSSWPMMAGDEIVTGKSPAELKFRDGSKVRLAANSRAKVEREGDLTALRILSGAATYSLSKSTSLRLYSQSRVITPTAPVGSVGLSGIPEVATPDGGTITIKTIEPPPVSRRR